MHHTIHQYLISLVAVICCCYLNGANSQSLSGSTYYNDREGMTVFMECILNGATGADGFSWSGPGVQSGRVTIVNSTAISRLTFSMVEGDDEGVYVCSHSSAANDLHITLDVIRNPVFISQDVNPSAYEGGDVVLTCQVKYCGETGDDCYDNLRWRRAFGDISSHSVTTEGDITTITATIIDAQQSKSGDYECLYSSNRKQVFTLTVNPASERVPMISKSSDNQIQRVYYDQPLKLACPVRSGENSTENPMNISWVFTNIHGQKQFVTGPVLTIEPGCFTRGIYTCTAANSFGADSLPIFVEINAPPLPAEVSLPSLTVTEGDQTATLTLKRPTSPVAISSLEYHWEKLEDGKWVPLSTSTGKYTIMHNGHLKISSITLMDAGFYQVNISNEFGSSVQTRQVDVSTRPTSGEPVAIGFTFTLPETTSCAQVKESRDLLTKYLSNYLSTLCLNTTTNETGCKDIVVQNVTVDCPSTSRQGAFRARLRSSSHAQHTARVFENNGPTKLDQHISIEPCGDGQCVLPTEVIETLTNLVAILVAIVVVLVVVVIVTIVIVICVLKHTKNCRQVDDLESNRLRVQRGGGVQRSISCPADTLGQIKQQNHYYNC